jgi:hypothetical protein
MTGNSHDERWRELCEAIVQEPDSKRLMELVEKLNQVLDEREERKKDKRAKVQHAQPASQPTFCPRDT